MQFLQPKCLQATPPKFNKTSMRITFKKKVNKEREREKEKEKEHSTHWKSEYNLYFS